MDSDSEMRRELKKSVDGKIKAMFGLPDDYVFPSLMAGATTTTSSCQPSLPMTEGDLRKAVGYFKQFTSVAPRQLLASRFNEIGWTW